MQIHLCVLACHVRLVIAPVVDVWGPQADACPVVASAIACHCLRSNVSPVLPIISAWLSRDLGAALLLSGMPLSHPVLTLALSSFHLLSTCHPPYLLPFSPLSSVYPLHPSSQNQPYPLSPPFLVLCAENLSLVSDT